LSYFFTHIYIVRFTLILALAYLAYVDLRTFRLPDAITLPMIIGGLVFNCLPQFAFTSTQNAIAGAVVGYLFFWAMNFIYRAIRQQNVIGMGDAKLLAALGAWLGALALPEILLMASITGLLGGIIWLFLQRQSLRSAFPFGPFLAIAGIIELLWPQALQTLLLNHLT
jgi:leader peptidase (prepilin peptidase)/N-methyltransferase